MTKTELLNKAARNGEERLLLARVLDKLELARRRNIPSHTGFLSPGERACVEALLAAAGHPRHLFFGGYEGAQRNICVFLPDWQEPEDFQTGGDCPVCALRASFPADGALTHRDFLGSVLGLGLDREKVGDLLVGEGACDLIVLEEIRDFLLLHLEQAGRVRLRLAPVALERLSPPPVQGKLIRDTVSSLRLDAVAASGFSLARSKAADLISSGRFQLNYRECVKPDRAVAQGDVISCRGLGKCVVQEVGGTSRGAHPGRDGGAGPAAAGVRGRLPGQPGRPAGTHGDRGAGWDQAPAAPEAVIRRRYPCGNAQGPKSTGRGRCFFGFAASRFWTQGKFRDTIRSAEPAVWLRNKAAPLCGGFRKKTATFPASAPSERGRRKEVLCSLYSSSGFSPGLTAMISTMGKAARSIRWRADWPGATGWRSTVRRATTWAR